MGRWRSCLVALSIVACAHRAASADTRSEQQAAKLVEKGITLLDAERNAEAEVLFRRAVALVPAKGAPHFWLGKSLVLQQRCDEGVTELNQYLDLSERGARLDEAAHLIASCRLAADEPPPADDPPPAVVDKAPPTTQRWRTPRDGVVGMAGYLAGNLPGEEYVRLPFVSLLWSHRTAIGQIGLGGLVGIEGKLESEYQPIDFFLALRFSIARVLVTRGRTSVFGGAVALLGRGRSTETGANPQRVRDGTWFSLGPVLDARIAVGGLSAVILSASVAAGYTDMGRSGGGIDERGSNLEYGAQLEAGFQFGLR